MPDLVDIKDKNTFDKEKFIHKINSYLASIYGYIQMAEKNHKKMKKP